MADWKGRGGGRKGGQPTVSDTSLSSGGGKTSSASSSSQVDTSAWPTRKSTSSTSAASSQASRSTAASKASGMSAKDQVADPEGNYVFALEINGVEVAQFLECSGLKTSTEVYELQEGGMNFRVHKLPGQSRWENVTLRYGVTTDTTLLQWRDEILQDAFGKDSRRNGSIVMKNHQMETVRRYNFLAAWPVAWEGPGFQTNSSEIAIEMVELAHHGIYVS